jgi:ethanolamine kinase
LRYTPQIIIDRERENALFALLAQLGFAPEYLGRFRNGRVEGYMEASALTPEQLAQTEPVDVCGMIARELARMHDMRVEADLTPVLWTSIETWRALAAGEVSGPLAAWGG